MWKMQLNKKVKLQKQSVTTVSMTFPKPMLDLLECKAGDIVEFIWDSENPNIVSVKKSN